MAEASWIEGLALRFAWWLSCHAIITLQEAQNERMMQKTTISVLLMQSMSESLNVIVRGSFWPSWDLESDS